MRLCPNCWQAAAARMYSVLGLCLVATLTLAGPDQPSTQPIRSEGNHPRIEQVRYEPLEDQRQLPELFRLERHQFLARLAPKCQLAVTGVCIQTLTFPSPVESPYPVNNTVHCSYFRPAGQGPFPAVIILDILAGDQTVSRTAAMYLAQNGIAGLCLHLPYYGPRRPAGEKVRFLSPNVKQTTEAMRQAVLDCRRAATWLAAQSEVDSERLGIMGTSLGSFPAAMTCAMEPRLKSVALLLGGGGLVEAYQDHPEMVKVRPLLQLLGADRDALKKLIDPIDPITYADRLKTRRVLMIAAKHDEVVPAVAAKQLWEASGKQRIVWYDTSHVGAALYTLSILEQVRDHFAQPSKK